MSEETAAKKTCIHATLISLDNSGILLLGPSGSGKSDLALRFIATPVPTHLHPYRQSHGELVADDQVLLTVEEGQLWGSAPDNLKGLIEVRSLGIQTVPYKTKTQINLAIMLKNHRDIERYPDVALTHSPIQGITLPLKYLDPFEPSAISKLFLACKNNGS